MNKNIIKFLIGGALLSMPFPSNAETCYITRHQQFDQKGSRCPARPIAIDVTNNVLTVPEWFVGYILILTEEQGEQHTYIIKNKTNSLPEELKGIFDIQITNGNQSYEGSINIK